jgi:hypothetical protein
MHIDISFMCHQTSLRECPKLSSRINPPPIPYFKSLIFQYSIESPFLDIDIEHPLPLTHLNLKDFS